MMDLANGIRVAILPVPRATLVHLAVFEGVGIHQEPRGKEGISHLLEHLAFTSSRSYPAGGLQAALALHAAHANATTTHAYVVYETVCLPASLPDILRLEVDRFSALDPTIDELERERGVVREELAYRGRYSPIADLHSAIFRASYPGHPFSRAVGGTDSSVATIRREDLDAFHAANIQPQRTVLVLVGNVDTQTAGELVEATFGAIPKEEKPQPADLDPLPPLTTTHVVLDRYDMEGGAVMCGFRLPASTPKERALNTVIPGFLGSASVRSTLRRGPQESNLFLWSRFKYRRPSYGEQVLFDPDRDSQEAYRRLWSRIETRVDSIYRQPYFNAIRDRALEDVRAQLQDPEWLCETLGTSLLFDGGPEWIQGLERSIMQLTPEEVRASIQKNILNGKAVSGCVHGRDSRRARRFPRTNRLGGEAQIQAGDATAALDSAQMEAMLTHYETCSRPLAQQFSLGNGIPVTYLPLPGAATVYMGGAKSFDYLKDERPGKKPGLCLLYNSVVRYGTRDQSKEITLAREAEFVASPYSYSFVAHGSATSFEDVTRALVHRLEDSSFNTSAWMGTLAEAEALFAGDGWSPEFRARYQRWKRILGSDHPALGAWKGDSRILSKLVYQDLVNLHEKLSTTGNLQIIVTGDVNSTELQAVLERSFGKRPAYRPVTQWERPPKLPRVETSGDVIPAFDELDCGISLTLPPVSTAVSAGLSWAEKRVLERTLQGYLTRRLRQEKGVVYFVRCTIWPLPGEVVLEISTACLSKHGPQVLSLLRDALQNAVTLPPGDILRAKLAVCGSLAMAMDNPESAFNVFQDQAELGVPPLDAIPAVRSVDVASTLAWIGRLVANDAFAYTVSGPILEEDIEKFESELKPVAHPR